MANAEKSAWKTRTHSGPGMSVIGRPMAIAVSAHRLRDQMSQAMALAAEFILTTATHGKQRAGHFHGHPALLEMIAQGLRKLAGLFRGQNGLRAQDDAVV